MAVVLFVAGCGSSDNTSSVDTEVSSVPVDESTVPERGSVTIACICDLSGPLATNGLSVYEGAQLAVQEVNDSGGVLNNDIKLVSYDDRTEPARATTLFIRAVVEDGIVAAVMGGGSAVSLAVRDVANEEKIPLVLANQQSGKLTDPPHPFAFRVTMSSQRWVEELVPFIKAQGWTRVGVFYRDDAYGQGGRDATALAFEGTGLVVSGTVALQPDGADFTAQVQDIRASKPDILLSFAFPQESVVFANNIRTLGWDISMIGNQGWGVPEIITAPALEGSYYPDLIDLSRPDVQAQLQAYEAKFNRSGANAYNIQGYDAVKLIVAAMEAAGSTESVAIATALEGVRYESLEGTAGSYLQYTPTDHNGPHNDDLPTPMVIYQIVNGAPQPVKF